jgi:hypothetical protein
MGGIAEVKEYKRDVSREVAMKALLQKLGVMEGIHRTLLYYGYRPGSPPYMFFPDIISLSFYPQNLHDSVASKSTRELIRMQDSSAVAKQ